jgi:hypothetical protein
MEMSQAWRLTFAYDGDKFTLKSTRKLVKRVPPSQAHDTGHAGRFVELRGPNRQILYRRAITELIPDTVEYPTGDPAQPLGRVAAPRRGEVAILVPAPPEGHSVAIVVGRPGRAGKRTKQSGAETSGPRDLIAVDLPREGDKK